MRLPVTRSLALRGQSEPLAPTLPISAMWLLCAFKAQIMLATPQLPKNTFKSLLQSQALLYLLIARMEPARMG